ncbi:MAG: hypothetical protein ACK4F6_05535 [Hylemonella sp.]
MVTHGQEREWLLEKYVANARFELRAGNVVVWEPMSGEVPGPLVEFAGVLDDEAARVLGELLRKGRIHTLSLTGPGGLVEPTLKLGRAIRAKGVTTAVETGRGCYSACAMLFLAGDRRIVGNESKDWFRASAAVGFHAPYTLRPDGTARHLQDVKTSSSCAYIRQLVPAPAAAELCAYTLATKGMATFSLDAGKRLYIYTDSESDVLERWADGVYGTTTSDEKQWVTCERFKMLVESSPSRPNAEPMERFFPCSGGIAPQAPTPHSRSVELSKLARALGPSRVPNEVMDAAYQTLADRALLTAEDRHYIDCQRANKWLIEQGKSPTSFNSSTVSPEFQTWQVACILGFRKPEGRRIEGIGYVTANLMALTLDRMARSQGAVWPPPESPRVR